MCKVLLLSIHTTKCVEVKGNKEIQNKIIYRDKMIKASKCGREGVGWQG